MQIIYRPNALSDAQKPEVTLTFNIQNLISHQLGLVNIPCQFYENCLSCS